MIDNPEQAKKILLICLPFAGGNSFAYQKLGKCLDDFIQPMAVELPGHGLLFNESQLDTLDDMTDYVLDMITEQVSRIPWALFGHSMGGMLGYLIARRAPERLLPPPLHLFISAHRPGSVKPPFYWTDLSRDEFLARISRLGGIPEEVLTNGELMELFEPIIYRDVKALETHPHDDTVPVTCPITVLIGRDDDIPEDHARLWHRETVSPISVRIFPGGHFFSFERVDEIGRLLSETLARNLADNLEFRHAQINVMASGSRGHRWAPYSPY